MYVINKRLLLAGSLFLCLTIALEAKKTLMIAINLNGLIDVSNLVDPIQKKGAVYDAVKNINETIIHPLNQASGSSSRGRATYRDIEFHSQSDLHMALAYVGNLEDNRADEHDAIIEDLKNKLRSAIEQWVAEKSNKTALKCSLDKIIWPPLGHGGIWLSYDVKVSDESQKEMLGLINRIHSVLSTMHQEWYGPFRDVRTDEQRFFPPLKSLEKAKLHVSIGQFNRGYTLDKETNSVFGLPVSERTKKSIDQKFQALPAPVQPNFDANQLVLYMKDEQHRVHVLEKVSLIPKEEKLVQ
jgi:hypothetical protein